MKIFRVALLLICIQCSFVCQGAETSECWTFDIKSYSKKIKKIALKKTKKLWYLAYAEKNGKWNENYSVLSCNKDKEAVNNLWHCGREDGGGSFEYTSFSADQASVDIDYFNFADEGDDRTDLEIRKPLTAETKTPLMGIHFEGQPMECKKFPK